MASSLLHSTCRPLLASLATHSAPSASLPAAYPAVAFQYRPGPLTAAELAQYHRDGFIIKRQFYGEDEMRYLLTIAKADRELGSNAIDVPDAGGRKSKLTVWNYLGEGEPDDIYSAIGRGDRMVGVMEQLLGDEVYETHTTDTHNRHTVGRIIDLLCLTCPSVHVCVCPALVQLSLPQQDDAQGAQGGRSVGVASGRLTSL